MSFNLKEYQDQLLFLPLGGSNEIGINVNFYHYQGKWLMVDCGTGFAEEHLPGVDIIVADISFIEKYKNDILGLVITHAHEDHAGAVQYLWNNLECSIYTTKFTANFLKIKLAEFEFNKKIPIHEMIPGNIIKLGPFSIESLLLTHSTPEMQALMIRTEVGNIVHTGDWKFDMNPILGEPGNEKLLKSFGDEGVLALVCDSTNVFQAGQAGSEGDLRLSIHKIIDNCKKMVVITTFASNITRLDTFVTAAQKSGRKIVLFGRSLIRMFNAAQASGYLLNTPLINEKDIAKYPREQILIIATGCQGEPLAATFKLATNNHNLVKLSSDDTVIFSSKIIPGNEKKIFKLFNCLVKLGVKVITEKDHFVHVSGHPHADELMKMYDLIRPKIAIPVHGEPIHLNEHVKLAKKFGVTHAIEVSNGTLVSLNKDSPKIITQVTNGYLAVDGNSLLSTESKIFKIRRIIRDDGLIIITLILKDDYLAFPPIISAPGLLDFEDDKEIITILKTQLNQLVEIFKKRKKTSFNESLGDIIKSQTKRILKAELGKRPMVFVNIENLKY